MALRAPSSRLAAKARAKIQAADAAEASKKRQSSTTKQPRKKQKITQTSKEAETAVAVTESNAPRVDDFRRIKGRRGQLKVMTELPIDILMEIFGHVEPYDLLRLSRASKALRAIIVGENTSSLWKKAYANLGDNSTGLRRQRPPSCPPRSNVLHFTDFLFGHGCQFCHASKASIVHWGARARMCNTCATKELIIRDWQLQSPSSEAHELSSACYIRKAGVLRHQSYILKREYDRHVRELEKCDNDEAKAHYKETCRQYLQGNVAITREIQAWVFDRRNDVVFERERIRSKRQKDITAKLEEAGYGPELATYRYRVSKIPGVDLPVPLTEKQWAKIKASIIGVYEWQRQETRKANMVSNFRKRMACLDSVIKILQQQSPKPWIYAPPSHIARIEPFSSIMKQSAEDRSDENKASMIEELHKSNQRIQELSNAWRDDADKFLLGLLRGTKDSAMPVDDGEIDRRPLELATTFFKCDCACAEPISYPRILMHSCIRYHKIPDKDKDDEDEASQDNKVADDDEDGDENEAEELGNQDGSTNGETHHKSNEVYGIPTITADGVWNKMSSWGGASWNEADMIEIDDEAIGSARAIVQACGEDPDTVTSATMNERDVRVECTRCVPPPGRKSTGRTRHIMTWKAAILHDIKFHFNEAPTAAGWKMVTDEEDLRQVYALEDKITPTEKRLGMLLNLGLCSHCDDWWSPHTPYLPVLLKRAPSETAEVKFTDKASSIQKRHICLGADAPMKAYPHPVKI